MIFKLELKTTALKAYTYVLGPCCEGVYLDWPKPTDSKKRRWVQMTEKVIFYCTKGKMYYEFYMCFTMNDTKVYDYFSAYEAS